MEHLDTALSAAHPQRARAPQASGLQARPRDALTSIDKALRVCEALSGSPGGMSVADLARATDLPRPTVHRLLAVLRRRGYVRQDEHSQRYTLTLKMLDLSFRLLGHSELRLHAYPVLREFVARSDERTFVAVPAVGEVTYVWRTDSEAVAMHTVYGRAMPAHCAVFFDEALSKRRLSCLKSAGTPVKDRLELQIQRLGPDALSGVRRLVCTCAPVRDYTGREVARIGVFRHGADDGALVGEQQQNARELARHISQRLGFVPPPA